MGEGVLFQEGLSPKLYSIVLHMESKLIIVDVNSREGSDFRLTAVYVPAGAGKPY